MSERVTFRSKNGDSIEGALQAPEGDGKTGAVILVHEWWGLTPQIERTVDRLAAEGFVVLAPDLYRGVVVELTDAPKAERLMKELDGARALADLGGALDYLKAHPRGNGKVGITGFCMGGAYAFAAAVHLRGLSAVVPFYGVPPTQDWSKIDAPVSAHFSATDGWAKPSIAEEIQKTLTDAGKPMDLHVYQAEHAFMNDARPEVFEPISAGLAWERLVEFLKLNLA